MTVMFVFLVGCDDARIDQNKRSQVFIACLNAVHTDIKPTNQAEVVRACDDAAYFQSLRSRNNGPVAQSD